MGRTKVIIVARSDHLNVDKIESIHIPFDVQNKQHWLHLYETHVSEVIFDYPKEYTLQITILAVQNIKPNLQYSKKWFPS